MSQALGGKTQVVIDVESTYGVSPVAPAPIGPMPFNKLSLSEMRALNSPETITGNLNPVEPFNGNTDVSGDIDVPVDLVVFGHWLKAVLGSEVSTVGGSKSAVSVTADSTTDKITLSTHGLTNGQGVTFGGTTVPGGLTAGTLYFVRDTATNDFKVAASPGATAIDLTTNGTSVTVTTVNAHVFKLGNDIPSLVVEKGFPDIAQYFLYNGVKAGTLSLDFGGDGELVAKLGLKGASPTQSGTAYNSGTKTSPGTFNRVGNFQAAISEAGAAWTKATKVTLNLDHTLDDSIFVIGGGGVRGDLPQGVAKVSGTISNLFDGVDLYTKALNSTKTSIAIRITKSNDYIEFLLPEVQFSLKSPPVDGPKGMMLDLDIQGYYATATQATALQVTLVNTRATAY
jgi:hypothetical protein